MDFGIFVVPFRLPGVEPKKGMDWDLQCVRWAEEFGFVEAWFGEHFTVGWEPGCSPELYIAAAAQQTERIRLGAGANLLPYHSPAALAHRLMMLDHMTEGRFMAGFGSGAYGADPKLFDAEDKDRRQMTSEALDIVLRIWQADGPFEYRGEFWNVDYPEYDDFTMGPHWRPYQKPHPPIAMAGVSPVSGSIREAGARGYIPLSFNLDIEYLKGHWAAYEEGAQSTGRTPDRSQWRLVREIIVADTDEEALELAVGENAALRRTYEGWTLPLYERYGLLQAMAPDTPVDEINCEYLARNFWLVGSPDTVVKRIEEHWEELGGIGTVIMSTFDYLDDADGYRRNFELLGTEVAPRVKHLVA
jgi:alkanesulfonate monooxygenase SsuD/methylene tetrahydromethanopterin reductase-like flavin-dependent oxidoreductase (luciferase family)